MRQEEFVEALNVSGNTFKFDNENINNGYPVLAEEETVTITFEDEILYKKILDKLLHKIEYYSDETNTIKMTQDNIDTVTNLELDNNSISSIEKIQNINGIQYFTNLITLDLAYNNIEDISELQYLTKLEYLSLSNNNISSIEALSGLDKLQTLYLNYNDIMTIPTLNCISLTYLDLRANKLVDITNISNLVNLEKLYLYNYTISGVETDRANAIADLSVLDELQKLTTIDARNQKLTYIGIVGEEIDLPLIFSQAKSEESIAYTDKDFIISNCTFDGTKIILGEDTTRKATITINGGILGGSSFKVIVQPKEIADYEYSINEDGTTITITRYTGAATNINIPNSINGYTVTSIGHFAFSSGKNLEVVEIPEEIISINSDAFIYCEKLTNINIDENNKNYSSENGVLFNKDKTCLKKYPRGKSDTEYIIPNTVTVIESYAFYACHNLENIAIHNGVTRIWNNVFENCNNLKNINVNKDNQKYCSENGILFNKDKTNLIAYPANKQETEYVIPDTVTFIESNAFDGCHSLIRIEIPEGVKNICGDTFYGCSSLTNIKIPSSVTSIGAYAFYGCKSLTYIKIPSNVNKIEDAFNNSITIICNDNTIAKEYAVEKGMSYVLIGDANGDYAIDFSDILIINKHRLGKIEITGINLSLADVTEDGKVDFNDILKINKYRLGKVDSF